MPEFTLTAVDRDDTGALSALRALWYRAYNSNAPVAPLSIAEASELVAHGASESLWRLAGTYEGQLVSMAFGVQVREGDGAGAPIPGNVLIRFVAVDAPFRNRGFGRETVSELLSVARAGGYSQAQLWVGSANVAAWQLYERLGFRASGRDKVDDRGERIAHLTVSLKLA